MSKNESWKEVEERWQTISSLDVKADSLLRQLLRQKDVFIESNNEIIVNVKYEQLIFLLLYSRRDILNMQTLKEVNANSFDRLKDSIIELSTKVADFKYKHIPDSNSNDSDTTDFETDDELPLIERKNEETEDSDGFFSEGELNNLSKEKSSHENSKDLLSFDMLFGQDDKSQEFNYEDDNSFTADSSPETLPQKLRGSSDAIPITKRPDWNSAAWLRNNNSPLRSQSQNKIRHDNVKTKVSRIQSEPFGDSENLNLVDFAGCDSPWKSSCDYDSSHDG